MATTPNFALRYQVAGDSPAGDDLGLNLATDVDNALATMMLNANVIRLRKTAIQSVNNTVVPVADNHLVFAAAANQFYIVQAMLLVNQSVNSTTADFRYGFSLPAGASWSGGGPNADATIGATSSGSGNWGATQGAAGTTLVVGVDGNAPNMTGVFIFATVAMGATPGNVAVMWAQGTAGVLNTSVNSGSHMLVHKI